jgi:hypothetical protein
MAAFRLRPRCAIAHRRSGPCGPSRNDHPGREPINSERSGDVRSGSHSGLKLDIARGRKVPNPDVAGRSTTSHFAWTSRRASPTSPSDGNRRVLFDELALPQLRPELCRDPGGRLLWKRFRPIESTTSLFNENARARAGLLIAKIQFNGIGGSQTYISLTPNSVVSALRFLWRGGL